MSPLVGIVLINTSEIAIRIYQQVEESSWQPLFEDTYFVASTSNLSETIKVIETIITVFSNDEGLGIEEWLIYVRSIKSEIRMELSQAIGLKVLALSAQREYDFIFSGILKNR